MANNGSVYLELYLKDFTPSGLQKIRTGAGRVFDDIDKKVAGTNRNISHLGDQPIKLKIDTSDLSSAIKEADRLKGKMQEMQGGGGMNMGGGFFKTSGAMMLGNLAAGAATWAARKTYEVGQEALQQGMDVEKNIVGLSTFVGDKRANNIYSRLQQISAHTPYTTNQLMPIERGLIAMGKSDTRAEKDMLSLANAVAATGGSDWALERMGWHLTQIAASGRVEGMQRREFAIAGIPYDKIMADYLGIKPDQVKKVKVTYDQLTGALDKAAQKGGMFAGALDKLSQTIYGKWTTIKDFWQIGLAKLTLSQKGNISDIEDRLISAMTKFPDLIAEATPVINKLFDSFNELWPTIKQFGSGLMDILKPIGGFLMGDDVKGLAKGIIDFGSAIVKTPGLIDSLNLALMAIGGAAEVVTGILNNMRNTWNFLLNHDKYNRDNDPAIKTDTRNGYIWGTLPLGASKAGLVVDSTKMQHMQDSLGVGNFFVDKKAADEWESGYMKKYYPKTQFQQNILPLPYMFPQKTKSNSKAGADVTADMSDAIVGGGPRQIRISFRNFTEHFTIQANGVKDGIKGAERQMEEWFLKMMRSVPA